MWSSAVTPKCVVFFREGRLLALRFNSSRVLLFYSSSNAAS